LWLCLRREACTGNDLMNGRQTRIPILEKNLLKIIPHVETRRDNDYRNLPMMIEYRLLLIKCIEWTMENLSRKIWLPSGCSFLLAVMMRNWYKKPSFFGTTRWGARPEKLYKDPSCWLEYWSFVHKLNEKSSYFLIHFAGGNRYSFRFLIPFLSVFDVIPGWITGKGKKTRRNSTTDFDLAAGRYL